MTEAIVVAIIGLGAGTLGSLTAPWAQWGVEKRRAQLARRQALVDSWRAGIVDWERSLPEDPAVVLINHEPTYVRTEWFATLRRHLEPSKVNALVT
jgi:hypothetical protein